MEIFYFALFYLLFFFLWCVPSVMADSTFVRIWKDLGIFSILIYLFILIQVLQVFLFEEKPAD